MKTIIIYASTHHGNTRKVVEAIKKECEVELVDATRIQEKDLKGYDTYGPFTLVGGIQKGHPDEAELKAAVEFYKGIAG